MGKPLARVFTVTRRARCGVTITWCRKRLWSESKYRVHKRTYCLLHFVKFLQNILYYNYQIKNDVKRKQRVKSI